jgi:hypothetical protein
VRCEDVVELLSGNEGAVTLPARTARAHAETCPECSAALAARRALHAEHYAAVPPLPARSFAHAIDRAVRPPERAPTRRSFWLGTAVGGALAAGIALAVALLWSRPLTGPLANPEVAIALNEVRAISMSLDSPEALAGAEIRVVLTGGVGLEGYDQQRELRWMTDLDRGVNELTLPVVALDARGGQITVEVQHGVKRRTFVLDVRTQAAPGAAANDAV